MESAPTFFSFCTLCFMPKEMRWCSTSSGAWTLCFYFCFQIKLQTWNRTEIQFGTLTENGIRDKQKTLDSILILDVRSLTILMTLHLDFFKDVFQAWIFLVFVHSPSNPWTVCPFEKIYFPAPRWFTEIEVPNLNKLPKCEYAISKCCSCCILMCTEVEYDTILIPYFMKWENRFENMRNSPLSWKKKNHEMKNQISKK